MHLHKTAVHLKRVVSAAGTDPAVEVVLRYPKSRLTPDEMGSLMAFSGHPVHVTLDASETLLDEPGAPRPMDRELERVNGKERDERMRPLIGERCSNCGELIADETGVFYVPPLGPPQPMHARCADVQPAPEEVASETYTLDEAIAAEADAASETYGITEDGRVVVGAGPEDQPIGDKPIPEAPSIAVTTPIRRKRR